MPLKLQSLLSALALYIRVDIKIVLGYYTPGAHSTPQIRYLFFRCTAFYFYVSARWLHLNSISHYNCKYIRKF